MGSMKMFKLNNNELFERINELFDSERFDRLPEEDRELVCEVATRFAGNLRDAEQIEKNLKEGMEFQKQHIEIDGARLETYKEVIGIIIRELVSK